MTYISGLGPTLAQNIVDYRTEHGPFQSRRELLKVPRMGEKAFEQSAGFLRIQDGKNPLDNSAVIGIKEKGLVHVSQLADKFVSDPTTVVSIHQHVRVKVMSIDLERKRIQLTMKGLNQ